MALIITTEVPVVVTEYIISSSPFDTFYVSSLEDIVTSDLLPSITNEPSEATSPSPPPPTPTPSVSDQDSIDYSITIVSETIVSTASANSGAINATKSSPNVGIIAGATVGGVAVLAILIFVILL